MSDEKADENPFSFKHFIKNKKETLHLDSSDEKIPGSLLSQTGSSEAHTKNDELPFPEVTETKKRTKGKYENVR